MTGIKKLPFHALKKTLKSAFFEMFKTLSPKGSKTGIPTYYDGLAEQPSDIRWLRVPRTSQIELQKMITTHFKPTILINIRHFKIPHFFTSFLGYCSIVEP